MIRSSMNTRKDFEETWMRDPKKMSDGYYNIIDEISRHIGNLKYSGSQVEDLGDDYRFETETRSFYWYEINGKIILGCSLRKTVANDVLIVSAVGKDMTYKNQPPYASDLYIKILTTTHKNIRLRSDKELTDNSINLWKKLFLDGHKVSVYDADTPTQTFKNFNTIKELEKFLNVTSNFKRYQYVLSESIEKSDA